MLWVHSTGSPSNFNILAALKPLLQAKNQGSSRIFLFKNTRSENIVTLSLYTDKKQNSHLQYYHSRTGLDQQETSQVHTCPPKFNNLMAHILLYVLILYFNNIEILGDDTLHSQQERTSSYNWFSGENHVIFSLLAVTKMIGPIEVNFVCQSNSPMDAWTNESEGVSCECCRPCTAGGHVRIMLPSRQHFDQNGKK